jgi:hypothetical protein
MSHDPMQDLHRVCVKLYADEPEGIDDDAATFVPIFHEWIREGDLDLVLFDVADYAHAPDSPGIMLVTHEVSFALDRSDGRFGLLGQRRTPISGGGTTAVAKTLVDTLHVAEKLERDPRLAGKLRFDRSSVRVEANDRLRAPNTDAAFESFSHVVRDAAAELFEGRVPQVTRVVNDPRDRLAVTVT